LTFLKNRIKWFYFQIACLDGLTKNPSGTIGGKLNGDNEGRDSRQQTPFVGDGSSCLHHHDVHAKILYANRYAERLFGYVKGEIEGKRIRALFLEEDQTYFLPNIIYLTAYKNGFEGEALLKQKDGAKIFVHLSSNSFKEGEMYSYPFLCMRFSD